MIVDSSVLIGIERRRESFRSLVSIAPGDTLAIAAITASELLTGVHRAESLERKLRRETFVETILGAVPIIAFDLPVARVHARILAEMMLAGRPIGAHDLLIAATALAYDHAVLTTNIRDFREVPGLKVQGLRW